MNVTRDFLSLSFSLQIPMVPKAQDIVFFLRSMKRLKNKILFYLSLIWFLSAASIFTVASLL